MSDSAPLYTFFYPCNYYDYIFYILILNYFNLKCITAVVLYYCTALDCTAPTWTELQGSA